MDKILFFFSLFILCNCCKAQKRFEFYFKSVSYKHNIERSEFSYDSSSGILFNRRPEQVIIKLNDEDKMKIYNFYKSLGLKSNSTCFTVEDQNEKNSYKIDFISKSEKNRNRNKNCSSDKKDVDKHLRLYTKIKNILYSKEEYKKAFPEEFEIY